MQEISVGILGRGFIGSLHHEELAKIDGFKVVAVADSNPKRFGGVAESVNRYMNYEALLEREKPDALVVALPDRLHLPAIAAAASQGIELVLLEKPLAQNLHDAKKIASLAKEKNLRLMVGLTGHYHPEFRTAHDNLPEIGKITSLDEKIYLGVKGFPAETYLPKGGRGIVLENGVHTFDRFLFFSQADIDLSSITLNYMNDENFRRNCDDNAAGNLKMTNEIPARFSFKWFDYDHEDYEFVAKGEKGQITVHGFRDCRLNTPKGEITLYSHDTSLSLTERHRPGIQAELRAFKEFIESKKDSLLLDYALKSQEVVERVYELNSQ